MAQAEVFYGCKDGVPSTRLEHKYLPELDEGEILVRVRLATICGSDLHTLKGLRQEATPGSLGHEAVVEVVTSRRHGITQGQRLSFTIMDSCSRCHLCQSDLPQKCDRLFKYGHSLDADGKGLNGCYATHIVIRPGTHVVTLPDHVTDKMAAPANCALATAVCGLEKVAQSCKTLQSALVQGAGMVGLYACALLKEHGFQKVYCSDISEDRLKLVSSFGGTPVLNDKLQETIESGSIDVVMEVCGAKSVFYDGIRVLRNGGTYILIGMVHADSRLEIRGEQIIRKCLTIIGVHNYAPRHLDQAIDFLSEHGQKYPFEGLVGHVCHLTEFIAAVELACSRKHVRVGLTGEAKQC